MLIAYVRKRRKRPELTELIEGINEGNRVLLSQAITLVESQLAEDQELAAQLMEYCTPKSGNSYRIGISGVPGVGKSTFIDSFGTHLINQGHKIAVLAIDPSSTLTKGSILGDKTRMQRISLHADAFIRPSPTAGSLGGVARKTREAILLCEAAGYEIILVETVGVGQSEITVSSMVDFFLLLMLPNAGDDLQGIKKGIMEIADGILINKADGAFLPKARAAKTYYSQALRLFSQKSEFPVEIKLVSALEEEGLGDVWDMLSRYRQTAQQEHLWETKRQEQALFWMQESITAYLQDQFQKNEVVRKHKEDLSQEVRQQKLSPIQAAKRLIKIWEEENRGTKT
ncbi:MAG: methylmalonyl Co-A mutase-associated GTPase MeaB [Bacteroidota bacterium]